MQKQLLDVVFKYLEQVATAIGNITEAHRTLEALRQAVAEVNVSLPGLERADVCYAFSKRFPLIVAPQP
jgi:hypothetical protein